MQAGMSIITIQHNKGYDRGSPGSYRQLTLTYPRHGGKLEEATSKWIPEGWVEVGQPRGVTCRKGRERRTDHSQKKKAQLVQRPQERGQQVWGSKRFLSAEAEQACSQERYMPGHEDIGHSKEFGPHPESVGSQWSALSMAKACPLF